MSVKRYEIVETSFGDGDSVMEVRLSENGDLVNYDDYEKLESELDVLKSELEVMKKDIEFEQLKRESYAKKLGCFVDELRNYREKYHELVISFDDLKKKLRWIPVSERLPEYSENELIIARSNGELLIPVLDGFKYPYSTEGLHKAMHDLKSTDWRYLHV